MPASGLRAAFALYETLVRRLNSLFAALAAALVLVVVCVIVLAIVTREMGISLLWANDVAQIAFVYLVFLSFGPALSSGHHVTVELFEPLVPRVVQRHLDVVAALACILFGAVFVVQLWALTSRSFADGRLAIMAVPVPLKWVQLAGPVGLVQFCLTAVLQLGLALLGPGRTRHEATVGHG
ncbi:MAG: TRAP transporter small permease [Rhodobacteraceae bacterium]|nr:TRAP transporter small permease [Paracoccaceae bacterium]